VFNVNALTQKVVDDLNNFGRVNEKDLRSAKAELGKAIDTCLGKIIEKMQTSAVAAPDIEAVPLEERSVADLTQEIMRGANRSFYFQAALCIGGTIAMALATVALALGAVAGIIISTIGMNVNWGLGAAGLLISIFGGAVLVNAAGFATAGLGMLTISLFSGELGCMESTRIRVNTATPDLQEKLIAKIKEAGISDRKTIKAILADKDLYQVCLAKQKVENELNDKKCISGLVC